MFSNFNSTADQTCDSKVNYMILLLKMHSVVLPIATRDKVMSAHTLGRGSLSTQVMREGGEFGGRGPSGRKVSP